MPLYEYQCQSCNQVTVVRQAMSDPKLKTCAQVVKHAAEPTKACGLAKAKVNRLISNSSFVLKGTGWYKTDYSSKPQDSGAKGADNRSDSKKSSESTPSSEASSSKPEAKAA